jgi:ABC-2 type transport system ATP-binding protein
MSVVLDAVSQGYGSTTVIDNLSATLAPGVTALLGPNGAGKTTLLRTLATIVPPRSGVMIFDGIPVRDERSARRVRDEIGYLPQDFGFDPAMRVTDFVEYAAWLRSVPAESRSGAIADALREVDLADRANVQMRKLSGGMQRRAGIAWAIVGRPRLIILDEPTVGLDPRQRIQFRKILTGLRESVVVLSTHLIDDVSAACDRVVVLNGGSVKFAGDVGELEAQGRADLPGHSDLERAYMHLLPPEEQSL